MVSICGRIQASRSLDPVLNMGKKGFVTSGIGLGRVLRKVGIVAEGSHIGFNSTCLLGGE